MKNKQFRNSIITFAIATVLYLVVSAIFFAPAVFQNKILQQSDVVNFYGMSKEAVDYRNNTGDEALWTNSMFGGMPTYQISMSQTGNLFEKLNVWLWLLPRPANYTFLAFLCFFILLKSFKVNDLLAVGGAFAYGMGTFLITSIEAGHNPKVNAMCYIPLVFTGLNYVFQKRYLLGACILLLGSALEFAVNHIQITYYMYLMIGCWCVSELIYAIKNKTLPIYFKQIAIIAVITIAAITTNTTRLWTTMEYGNESIRSAAIIQKDTSDTGVSKRDYAFQWSYGQSEIFTLLYPNFAGGGSGQTFLENENSNSLEYLRKINAKSPEEAQQLQQSASKYWGQLPSTSGPVYIGAIMCFLFILGLFLADGKLKWWILSATLISILLAWGKNFPAFNDFMFANLPMYDKFRTVMMALVIAGFTIPLLGILMLDKFLKKEAVFSEKQKINALKWSGGIVLLFTCMMLIPNTVFNLQGADETNAINYYSTLLENNKNNTQAQQQIQQYIDDYKGFVSSLKADRTPMIKSDALRTFIFIALCALLLWLALKNKLQTHLAIVGISLLSLVDLWSVSNIYLKKSNYVESDSYDKYFAQQKPKLPVKDDSYFRVVNTSRRLDQDGFTPYYFKSIGGYHGAKLQRIQDVIDGYLNKNNMAVYSMLNTKYFMTQDKKTGYSFQQNPYVCGNAWFVDTVNLVETETKEFESLANFNPKTTAFVLNTYANQIPNTIVAQDSTASVKLTKYNPNQLNYTYTSSQDGPIIFSEIFYRGNQDWNAYIDGKYTDHFKTDYLLRGIWAPKGTHDIVFKFEPKSYFTGKKITAASSSILFLLLVAGLGMEAYKQYKKSLTEKIKEL